MTERYVVPSHCTDPVEERFDITTAEVWADAIRAIAAATVQARGRVLNDHTFNATLPGKVGMEYLQEVERQLNALIAVGAVPPQPGRRRRLTS